MKKHRISKRIFAMLLVICMVFTMIPANEYAAYNKGDVVAGDMGMTDVDYSDKITWPIEIYDYSNDGMLFEYASYTGNTATWAQLDKEGEYCYLPELNAQYYADFTTDAINNSQVVRRWFDVWGWNGTASQTTDNISGLKYYTFQNFDGQHAELIDFRDPDSDDVIEWCDETHSVDTIPSEDEDGAKFKNAYGYTFIIDKVDEQLAGGDAALVGKTVFETYISNWAFNVVLEPVEGEDVYKVAQTIWGNGSGAEALSSQIDWTDNTLVMMIHADGKNNWMDWRAANSLEVGDTVSISAEKDYVKVLTPEGEKTSGVVSKEDVKYATLVYRTPLDVALMAKTQAVTTYANGYDWTNSTSQVYVFSSTDDSSTPTSITGQSENFFDSFYGVVLKYSTISAAWEVTLADFVGNDSTNAAQWNGLGDDEIVIMYHSDAEKGDNAAFCEFLKKYATVGAKFAIAEDISTLQSASGASTLTLSCNVGAEVDGSMVAYFRGAGSDENNLKSSATVNVPLSGENATSDWRYCVFDLSDVQITDDIQSAGIYLAGKDEYDINFQISHFAFFSSEKEAEIYGENALVCNKHHMQTIYPHNATYSTDFTTSEVENATSLIKDWWKGVHGYTEGNTATDQYLKTSINGRQHYTFTESMNWYYPEIELIDFNAIGGVNKDKLKYAVLIYQTTDVASGTAYNLYFRDKSDKDADGNVIEGTHLYNKATYALPNTDGFEALIFDLTDSSNVILPEKKIYSAGVQLTTYGTDVYVNEVGLDTDYTFNIRQFAFFETQDEMNAYIEQIETYNEYTGVPTSFYNPIYDNIGYSLLAQSREDASVHDKYEKQLGYSNATTNTHATAEDMIYYMAHNKADVDLKNYIFDGYSLLGTLTGGSFTAGLLEGKLGDDSNPVYREQVVEYLAKLLETTLVIPEYEGGYFNYDYVRGEKSEAYGDTAGESIDLATAIRRRVGINFNERDTVVNKDVEIDGTTYKVDDKVTYNGTEYAAGVLAAMNNSKNLKGTWAECKEYIYTCYDAAYFLLNNLFKAGSYNEPQDTYKYLVLNKGTLSSGKEAYVFDAGLTKSDGTMALDYNETNKTIGYDDATFKHLFYTSSDVTDADGNVTASGTTTTRFPFLPVRDDNTEEGMTKSPYFADPGVGYDGIYGETYYERDFNYVIKSHGEFVYHEDDGLFFDFEGDDDVYMFINGQLVLDIGGAHSITKESIDVNEYVQAAYETLKTDPNNERAKALALEEGQACTFDFFYMERHGYGANCRIATNLRVTDPSLQVNKTAHQDNIEINYGGVVDETKPIEYRFALTNTGNTKLYNISFDDPFIGVTIDGEKGLYIKDETRNNIFASDASPLDPGELTAIVTGYKAVDDGTGNYKDDGNGNMVEVAVGEGTHIATENVVKFNNVKDKNGNPVDPNEALKNFMKSLEDGEGGLESGGTDATQTGGGGGLWTNSTVVIKGIYYTMTAENVEDACFNNTVYVTATTMENTTDASCETLQGQASHKINIPADPYYYQWSGNGIIITPERLVTDVLEHSDEGEPFFGLVDDLNINNISKIEETTSNERPITTTTVTIDASNNVTVNYSDTGAHVFYLKISYLNATKSVLVPVVVNVADVEDSYMVLDYGLTVDLTEKNEIFKYDTVNIPGREADVHLMAIADGTSEPQYDASYNDQIGKHVLTFAKDEDNKLEEAYGTFELSGEDHSYSLTYTPGKFMEGMDSIYAAVNVHEKGFESTGLNSDINIGKEVQMFKKISVLPANVVYYEDDFPAIKYVDEEGEELSEAIFNQVNGSKDLTQSPDQDQEYGKDDAYKTNDKMSGNSITQITIKESGQVAYFEFTGTGFELISQTNAFDSAKFAVEVKDKNDVTVRDIPVITEFDNGGDKGEDKIYQVPVIRVDDLDYGTYKVYISGIPSRDYTKVDGQYTNVGADGKPAIKDTILYIDGLRIFNPLPENETEEYYNESENGAIFEEIRELIVGAQAAVATYQNSEETTTVSYGTITWTENRNNSTHDEALYIGNKVASVNDYMALGPNNEVYMDGDYEGVAALVFYVKETGIGENNLQIAARAIDKGLFEGKDATGAEATLEYAVLQDEQIVWKPLADITSATEQYYTIDYTACPYIQNKGYQVAIRVVDGMVSYSSLKYNRLEIGEMSTEFDKTTLTYNANGILVDANTNEEQDIKTVPAFSILTDTFASNASYKEVGTDIGKILYQTRNDSDLRLIAYVDELEKYSSVSFTLTIDGRTTKELVCTTAYSGLYANGEEYSTSEIFGSDGFFVTYTINGYLNKYKGKEVKIVVTYTERDGDKTTIARTETITIGGE